MSNAASQAQLAGWLSCLRNMILHIHGPKMATLSDGSKHTTTLPTRSFSNISHLTPPVRRLVASLPSLPHTDRHTYAKHAGLEDFNKIFLQTDVLVQDALLPLHLCSCLLGRTPAGVRSPTTSRLRPGPVRTLRSPKQQDQLTCLVYQGTPRQRDEQGSPSPRSTTPMKYAIPIGSRYLRTSDGRTEVSMYFRRMVERGVWQDIRFGWSWTLRVTHFV